MSADEREEERAVTELQLAALIEQRDELLAALKSVMEWQPRQMDEPERAAYELAQAAIARAEGRAK